MKVFGLNITREKRKVTNDTTRIPLSNSTGGGMFYFSPQMSVAEMLANPTLASCVYIISDAVAGLSCNVYKRTKNGRVKDDMLSLSKILKRNPNYDDTAFTFKQQIMLHLLCKGNAFIFVERNPDYTVRALYPLDPDSVDIKRDSTGEVYYLYNLDGRQYKYNTSSILHIPAIRYNRLRGLSPIEYATHTAKTGLKLDEYTEEFFENGVHSKVLLTVPGDFKNWTKEDDEKLQARFIASYGGKENANKPVIMHQGMTASPIDFGTNRDNQLQELRAFSEKEVAKIYRVPLFMLGKDDAKFTNTEQLNTYFLQQTLTPWLVRIQEYLDRLLPSYLQDDYYVEFDTNTLLRADYAARMEGYVKGLLNGIYTPNQIMAMENMPAIDKDYGDEHYMQVNMSTLAKIAKQQEESGEEDDKNEN